MNINYNIKFFSGTNYRICSSKPIIKSVVDDARATAAPAAILSPRGVELAGGDSDEYLVVDINYFPGIAKMPGYSDTFCDFLRRGKATNQ